MVEKKPHLSDLSAREIANRKEIDLSGQVAIVTGASRGIGRAIAEGLGRSGANVVVNSRSDATEVVSNIESFGGKGLWVPGDILQEETRNNLIEQTVDKFGRLDILINNVGKRHDGLLLRTTDKEFDEVLEINLKSAVSMTRLAVRQMLRQKPQGGKIVFIGSLADKGSPGQSFYSAAKAGLVGFAKAIAREYESRNIHINVVSPGLVDTDMVADLNDVKRKAILDLTGMERALTPEEVVVPVLNLLSETSTETGRIFNITGVNN
jgi:3-oxoacyl-[acyl-carrier protein] reductase